MTFLIEFIHDLNEISHTDGKDQHSLGVLQVKL